MKNISLITCISLDNVIGISNVEGLPYRISADLKRFKELTTGHTIIMGSKTYDSIGSKPLPNRQNVVITRNVEETHILDISFHKQLCFIGQNMKFPGCLRIFKNEPEVFIIGGGEIYAQTINLASKLYLTIVVDNFSKNEKFKHIDKNDRILFPEFKMIEWNETFISETFQDAKSGYYFYYKTYERKNSVES